MSFPRETYVFAKCSMVGSGLFHRSIASDEKYFKIFLNPISVGGRGGEAWEACSFFVTKQMM